MTRSTHSIVPFERYPGLPPLFLEFLHGLPAYYPDPPTLESAARRGKELLGKQARLPAAAFRSRRPEALTRARDLTRGRAVAVLAGHQIGLFTGPLFTLLKAFDAIRVAHELERAGIPAVPVFYALTDDHDLEEIARTARPGPDGPQILVLEGADRSNRRPVGALPIPSEIAGIVDAFRQDARGGEAERILDRFAARSASGVAYGDAFIETLFDLVEPEPLLVLDPLQEDARRVASDLFRVATARRGAVEKTLRETEERLRGERRSVPVPLRPDVFPFFTIARGERRRVRNPAEALERVSSGEAAVSADVLTRPLLKSFAMPVAASILGPSEIAYHAQALPLFSIFDVVPPVLLPRSHVVLLGPAERRAAEALGIAPEDLLAPAPDGSFPPPPEAEEVVQLSSTIERDLGSLEPRLRSLDPTLVGALETTRRKVAYQLEQLRERMTRAAERRDDIASKRRKRLETMLLPAGAPADRLYPPLVPLLAYGESARAAIRDAASGSLEGAVVLDLAAPLAEDRDAG